MENTISMNLVWHNCRTCPPKEYANDNLYISDGKHVCQAAYSKEKGWYNKTHKFYVFPELVREFWWADLERNVLASDEFAEVLNSKKSLKEKKTNGRY